jgi:hypothetical protein
MYAYNDPAPSVKKLGSNRCEPTACPVRLLANVAVYVSGGTGHVRPAMFPA